MKLKCTRCSSTDFVPFKPWIECHVEPRWFGLFGPLVMRERETAKAMRCAHCLHEMIASAQGMSEPPTQRIKEVVTEAANGSVPEKPEPKKRDPIGDPLALNWRRAAKP